MNNKIEPYYVDFNTAKWLKEKGFNESTLTYWSKRDGLIENEITLRNHNGRGEWGTSRPEQHVVVEWLRINHNVHVRYTVEIVGTDEWMYGYNILYLPFEFNDAKRRCPHMVEINSFKEGSGSYLGAWDTPQAAYLTAFDYIKDNNLI